MLDQLNDLNWDEAFKYGDGFRRDDVVEIAGIRGGENDFSDWVVYGKLEDGRWFTLRAWCDYTGWGCQEGGSSDLHDSKEEAERFGLSQGERDIFGIVLAD